MIGQQEKSQMIGMRLRLLNHNKLDYSPYGRAWLFTGTACGGFINA